MPVVPPPYRVAIKPGARILVSRVPLKVAAICGNAPCEEIFNLREARTCPACGSAQVMPLAAWLQERRTP